MHGLHLASPRTPALTNVRLVHDAAPYCGDTGFGESKALFTLTTSHPHLHSTGIETVTTTVNQRILSSRQSYGSSCMFSGT